MDRYCSYYDCYCEDVTEKMQEETGEACYDNCEDCPSFEKKERVKKRNGGI